MNKTVKSPTEPAEVVEAKEKILFDIQPLLLPTILNFETLVTIGFMAIAVIAAVIFHMGLWEMLIIALLFLILAVPSFRTIFMAGSTNYVLTNKRLVIFTVGFGQKERSIPLDQISTVRVRYSGLQRFYGGGDVLVKQKGLRGTIRMFGVPESKRRADQISKAMKNYETNAKAGNI